MTIARFHIEGIADEHHYHDRLEQKLARLEVLIGELRAEWDEFIEANLAAAEEAENPGADEPVSGAT